MTFHDPQGEVRARERLFDLIPSSAVTRTTAGPTWDDDLAGTFARADTTVFILDGRSVTPLVFDPRTGARLELDHPTVVSLQRTHARTILEQAHANLLSAQPDGLEPWRLAATGWARLVGACLDETAVPVLLELGALALVVRGRSTLTVSRRQIPRDRVRIEYHALDPLRLAVNSSLLTLGHDAGLVTMQLAQRRGWLGLPDWISRRS